MSTIGRYALLLFALACTACKSPVSSPEDAAPSPAIREARDTAATTSESQARAHYERLLRQLPSPCGAGQSLQRSLAPSARCRRASFAAHYVETMLRAGGNDDQVTLVYENRYVYPVAVAMQLDGRARQGGPDAPIRVVEFIDYDCKPCRALAPLLDRLVARYDGKIAVYFKQYPLADQHPQSPAAAAAAVAAGWQGKYGEMHRKLLATQGHHSRDDLRKYGAELGLDGARFRRDLAAAARVVDTHLTEGGAANLSRTPSIAINGRLFTDLPSERNLVHWIDEELAVLGR